MLIVGENAKQHVDNYSNQFKSDFLSLLRTSHGEKKVNANHFYQEYIGNKEHIHMNATRWISLSEFVKYLGREGICRVEEGEKGFFISWIDNSPEALRRQEAIRKKDRQDKGDEEREQRAIQEQIERARKDAEASGKLGNEIPEEERLLVRGEDGEKVKLALTVAPKAEEAKDSKQKDENEGDPQSSSAPQSSSTKVSMNVPSKKPKNVFASMGKKSGDSKKPSQSSSAAAVATARPMSQAEKIMKEELERKRIKSGLNNNNDNNAARKRQRVL